MRKISLHVCEIKARGKVFFWGGGGVYPFAFSDVNPATFQRKRVYTIVVNQSTHHYTWGLHFMTSLFLAFSFAFYSIF